MNIQKGILVFYLLSICSGCFGNTYSTTQTGPDRYAVKSSGHEHGAQDYVQVLHTAYETCKGAGFEDYVETYRAADQRVVVLHIRCNKGQEEVAAKGDDPNSTVNTLKQMYGEARKKIAELMENRENNKEEKK